MIDDAVFGALDYLLGKDVSEAGALVRQALGAAYFDADHPVPDDFPAAVGAAPRTADEQLADADAQLAAAQAKYDAAKAAATPAPVAPAAVETPPAPVVPGSPFVPAGS